VCERQRTSLYAHPQTEKIFSVLLDSVVQNLVIFEG
jgi:hypothetical protein